MASSEPPPRQWGNVGNKFNSFRKSFRNSIPQTVNGFTGIEQPPDHARSRSFRSATAVNSNDIKSPSGARQYQSGRRRSIDRTPGGHAIRGHYSSSSISSHASLMGHAVDGGKYSQKGHARKRSLLMGREYGINSGSRSDKAPSPSPRANGGPRSAQSAGHLPPNFYPPESFVNLLYRITEMESGSTHNISRFGLAILDIDNLRGHIQSPLQKHDPHKPPKPKPSTKMKPSSKMKKPNKNRAQQQAPNGTASGGTVSSPTGAGGSGNGGGGDRNDGSLRSHKKQSSSPNLPRKELLKSSDDEEDGDVDSGDTDDDEHDDEDSVSASPLSEVVDHISPSNTMLNEEEMEMKYIDAEDLQGTVKVPQSERIHSGHGHGVHGGNGAEDDEDSSDDGGYGRDETAQSAAERTAAINRQRRKSSLLLQQQDLRTLQEREAMKEMNGDHKEESPNGAGGGGSSEEKAAKKRASRSTMDELSEIQKTGHFLPVGDTNMDPYLLFWNNSKKGESVVKVVQDIILMSISKEINATHFGFGEFAILANVGSESELRRILKKILKTVSSNVATQKLGPVTLCGGLAMYQKGCSISQWVNQCRQACRLAKTNGRGRVANYITQDDRRRKAIELMLEIKKPPADFSGARVLELIRSGADLNFQHKHDTPLMVAIKKKNEVALRYIIQYDYNPNVQDKKGRTGLILALDKDCDGIILDLLVSKRDLNPRSKDNNGNSALSIALKKGYRDIAKTLILLGSEPLLGEKTVLEKWFGAAKCGNIKTIEMMLDTMSFPIDMIDSSDMTALMLAASNGYVQLVEYLLDRGANVNIQGRRGYTALMLAIEHSKVP